MDDLARLPLAGLGGSGMDDLVRLPLAGLVYLNSPRPSPLRGLGGGCSARGAVV